MTTEETCNCGAYTRDDICTCGEPRKQETMKEEKERESAMLKSDEVEERPNCGSCYFAIFHGRVGSEITLHQCRRNAPVIYPPNQAPLYPMVRGDDIGCGQFLSPLFPIPEMSANDIRRAVALELERRELKARPIDDGVKQLFHFIMGARVSPEVVKYQCEKQRRTVDEMVRTAVQGAVKEKNLNKEDANEATDKILELLIVKSGVDFTGLTEREKTW